MTDPASADTLELFPVAKKKEVIPPLKPATTLEGITAHLLEYFGENIRVGEGESHLFTPRGEPPK